MISLPLQGVTAGGAGARDPTSSPTAQPLAAAPPDPTSQPAIPASPPAVLTAAAASQGGLAPLLADLAAALSSGELPPAAQAAAQQVLGFGLDADGAPSGDALQTAVATSGLFLESDLAAGQASSHDFKAMLLDLAATLQPLTEGGATARRSTPPPPIAGGAVRGQAAVVAAPMDEATLETLAGRLLGETRAALSRQALMQAASSRSMAKGVVGAPTRWLFELPMTEGEQRAVAQFEIARDGRRGDDPDERTTARARFSLDLAGLGPVHASLVLTGERVQVALWAEHGETAVDLADRRNELIATLRDEGLPADVVVRDGAPSAPPPPAGRFMDTAA